MRAREVTKRIEELGGIFVRQVGSHRRYNARTREGERVFTTVPMHNGDIPLGTLRAIEKDLAPAFGKGWLVK
uniref:type II toxin-antitoxin system HicA family toxin n=1 Tax=Vaginimicrobium propionicum TaxID=1871034 RepID=UPI000970E32C|nr:type II toxin-antitoxin system HicA family toxin [Vaginimicrobium propionicum]